MNTTEEVAAFVYEILMQSDFEDWVKLTRQLKELPRGYGLYAVRHREHGLLYLGKALNLQRRFRQSGHKSLLWSWLEDYDHQDVRIAYYQMDFLSWNKLSSDLEAILVNAHRPPFNSQIPYREQAWNPPPLP